MINVAILGATGTVGQKCISLLQGHPQFRITELVASEQSAKKRYKDACVWKQEENIPENIADMIIRSTQDTLSSPLLFSGLDSTVALEVEEQYARQGHIVISNAKNHRMNPLVPLVIPELNHEHLFSVQEQKTKGAIITNSNCSTMAIALAIGPLHKNFTITKLMVHTMQAISGAGYPGVPSLDILDNVVPYIDGEEEKIETEPLKILGDYIQGKGIVSTHFDISAHCNRVPVLDGHTACISLSFETTPTEHDIIQTWQNFQGFPQAQKLHSAPLHPLLYFTEENRPQPRLDRMKEKGMASCIGRLRPCTLCDYKFTVLGHNTIRGAAGAAILNAEAFVRLGLHSPYF